jgi:osmotically-inducible protein OsmY
VAVIYFGSFSLQPQDISLSRQALFKLSFLHRHFLQPGGLRISVEKQTAHFSGNVTGRNLSLMAEILARQIEGIRQIKDETIVPVARTSQTAEQKRAEAVQESIQFLWATDQTLRSGVLVRLRDGRHVLEGEVGTPAQKNWAEQLAEVAGGEIDSKLKIGLPATLSVPVEPPPVDDESLQALILFRLRLVRETEHLPVKVTANRGVVALQGKVNTEALRRRVENIARSTLGVRELRSSLSIVA